MSPFYLRTPAFLLGALSCLLLPSAHAQEVYKWTDANGKVHYGDRAAAPQSSKQIPLSMTRASPQPAVPASAGAERDAPPPRRQSRKKPVPADPARVKPECKGLIDKIAAVPAGTNWEALYRQFDSTCPGIAYECVEYQSSPQKNQCTWVERSGSRVLNTSRYP